MIVAGIVINTLLMNLGVGGIIRDIVRLSVLLGLGMLLIGLVAVGDLLRNQEMLFENCAD